MGNDMKVVPTGTIKLESIDKNGLTGKSRVTGTVDLKKKVKDISFNVRLSDATLRDLEGLPDLVVTADRKLGSGLHAKLSYEVPKKSFKSVLTWHNEPKDVTLKGTWVESSNKFEGEATLHIDSQNKISSTYDFSNKGAKVAYSYSKDESTFGASYDFAKDKPVLTATTQRDKNTYKAEYAVRPSALKVEWSRKPYKVVASASMGSNGVQDVTTAVTLEQTFEW